MLGPLLLGIIVCVVTTVIRRVLRKRFPLPPKPIPATQMHRISLQIPSLAQFVPQCTLEEEHEHGDAESVSVIHRKGFVLTGLPGTAALNITNIFNNRPKVVILGRYKCGKSTIVRKFAGFPNQLCVSPGVDNTRGFDIFVPPAHMAGPILIDTEGFSQPLFNMDPHVLRDLIVNFTLPVAHCVVVVVNYIDLNDLQLISTLRSMNPDATIIVIHNLRDVSSGAHLSQYRAQIVEAMHLQPIPGGFGLQAESRDNIFHFVIGDLLSQQWNATRGDQDIFDHIASNYFRGAGRSDDFATLINDALSKVLSKYYEKCSGCGISKQQTKNDTLGGDIFARPPSWTAEELPTGGVRHVLNIEYVSSMRRAIELHEFQPDIQVRVLWGRTQRGKDGREQLKMIVNSPGFVLTGLAFLDSTGRALLLQGYKKVYGRDFPVLIRELVHAPVAVINYKDAVAAALASRVYDCNGAVVVTFFPICDLPQSGPLALAIYEPVGTWTLYDHRLWESLTELHAEHAAVARQAEASCCCLACRYAMGRNPGRPRCTPAVPAVPGDTTTAKDCSTVASIDTKAAASTGAPLAAVDAVSSQAASPSSSIPSNAIPVQPVNVALATTAEVAKASPAAPASALSTVNEPAVEADPTPANTDEPTFTVEDSDGEQGTEWEAEDLGQASVPAPPAAD